MRIEHEQSVAGQFRWRTPGPQPNGLQAIEEGLWVIDQRDLKMYLLDWEDGTILLDVPTHTNHSSGITWDGEAVWVASTHPPIALFRYSADGRELGRLATPGADDRRGAHGLEWIDGTLWVAVPPAQRIFQLDASTGQVRREFAAPGERPHGLAWDGELLWVAETTQRTLTGYTLDGQAQRRLTLTPGPSEGPHPHGLTYRAGALWYCDADTRAVCTVEL